jgi:hypothetical protein
MTDWTDRMTHWTELPAKKREKYILDARKGRTKLSPEDIEFVLKDPSANVRSAFVCAHSDCVTPEIQRRLLLIPQLPNCTPIISHIINWCTLSVDFNDPEVRQATASYFINHPTQISKITPHLSEETLKEALSIRDKNARKPWLWHLYQNFSYYEKVAPEIAKEAISLSGPFQKTDSILSALALERTNPFLLNIPNIKNTLLEHANPEVRFQAFPFLAKHGQLNISDFEKLILDDRNRLPHIISAVIHPFAQDLLEPLMDRMQRMIEDSPEYVVITAIKETKLDGEQAKRFQGILSEIPNSYFFPTYLSMLNTHSIIIEKNLTERAYHYKEDFINRRGHDALLRVLSNSSTLSGLWQRTESVELLNKLDALFEKGKLLEIQQLRDIGENPPTSFKRKTL